MDTHTSSRARLAAFAAEDLRPALARIARDQREALHRADLFRVGAEAAALRLRVSAALAAAEEEVSRDHSEQLDDVYLTETARARDEGLSRLPSEVLRARARERSAPVRRIRDELMLAREDLGAVLSFCQTAIRSLTEEEMIPRGGEIPLGEP